MISMFLALPFEKFPPGPLDGFGEEQEEGRGKGKERRGKKTLSNSLPLGLLFGTILSVYEIHCLHLVSRSRRSGILWQIVCVIRLLDLTVLGVS